MPRQLCVDKPEITEVLVRESGELLTAPNAIGTDYAVLEQLRMRLAESVELGRPDYLCPLCGVGVYLVCRRDGDDKRFFFRHRTEEGNCPAVTRETLTKEQMEARKYNGVKESDAHRRMKDIIEQSLCQDPEFSDIHIEKVWKGMDRGEWRKPDVQAVWRGRQRVVFEIQLSTTFLHVIAQRRLFYQREGALLVWVFKNFARNAALMTQDDIFYNNNRNLFVASEQTLQASKAAGALMLDCHWIEPAARGGTITDVWRERSTRFSELTQDLAQQRIYFFDHDGARPALLQAAQADELRDRFAAWWAQADDPGPDVIWQAFRAEFSSHGVMLPQFPSALRGLLTALYSARAVRPVGYQVPKLVSVAHTIAEYYPEALQVFRVALAVHKRGPQLVAEDRPKKGEPEGRWAKRVRQYREAMRKGEARYRHDSQWDSLIAFLFPEVWQTLVELKTSAR